MKLVDGLRRRSGLAPVAAAKEPRPDLDGGGEGSSFSVRKECDDEMEPAEYCETLSDDRAGLGGANALSDVVGDIRCGGGSCCCCSKDGVGKPDGAAGDQGRKVANGAGGAEREPDATGRAMPEEVSTRLPLLLLPLVACGVEASPALVAAGGGR